MLKREFSARQQEVWDLAKRDFSIERIAQELDIHPGTVLDHIERISTKLTGIAPGPQEDGVVTDPRILAQLESPLVEVF